MVRLDKALQAWGTPDFEAVLKREIAQLGATELPLQQGLSNSSSVAEGLLTVVIKAVDGRETIIRVKAVILYQGLIGGCGCADDPTPDNVINESCEVQLDIDRVTAETGIGLVADTS